MSQSVKRLTSMLLVLLFLAGSFILFFELVQPAYANVEALRGTLLGEQQSLNSETTLVKQAQNVISAYNNQNANESNVALAIPTGQDISGALAQLEGIAQNDSVNVTAIGVGSPTLTGENQNGTANGQAAAGSTPTVKPLGSFTLNISGSASYEAIQSFLMDLESNIRIFDVQSIAISPLSGTAVATGKNPALTSRDAFNYEMSVETYYQLP